MLTALATDELRAEIRRSKHDLEEHLGVVIDTFAYPYGSREAYDERCVAAVRAAGFRCAFVNRPGNARSARSPYALPALPSPRLARQRVRGAVRGVVSRMNPSASARDRLHVLMVNTHQTGGGAGRVGELLAEALRAGGDDVRALVRSDPAGRPHHRRAGHWREAGLVAWLAHRGLTDLGHISSLFWCCRPDFAAADVLHWHNLHGDYVSLAALPLWGFDKPIVWTLHDFWPLTGNCAAPGACTRWRRSCGHCPQVGTYPLGDVDRSRFYRWLKPRLFAARAAPGHAVALAERSGQRVAGVAGTAAAGNSRADRL